MVSTEINAADISAGQLDDKTLAEYISAFPNYPVYTEELIRRYMPLVKKSAARFGGSSDLREDLESEAYLAVLNAVVHYDEKKCGSLSAYLSVCVNNRIISVLRSLDRNTCCSDEITDTAPDNTTPETIVLAKELGSEIEKRLSSLEYNILRYCLDELSYSEIAVRLNITPKSVDNAVQRIRRKLKKFYGEEFNIWPQ